MELLQQKMEIHEGEEISVERFHELFENLIQISPNKKQKKALKDIHKAMFYKLGEEISEEDCKKLGSVLDVLLDQLHKDLDETSNITMEKLKQVSEGHETVTVHDISSVAPNSNKNNNATFMGDTMNNNIANVLPAPGDSHDTMIKKKRTIPD